MKFVRIEPGTFRMGSPRNEINHGVEADETLHEVTLSKPYFLGIHEVTRGQFAAFIQATKHKTEAELRAEREDDPVTVIVPDSTPRERLGLTWRKPGFVQDDNHPVVYVDWRDADAFCRWLSMKEKRSYRLPTEAEWEYACRAGTRGPYYTGEQLPASQANYYGTPEQPTSNDPRTRPVGSYPANPWGLHDMAGNVGEFVADWYGKYPAQAVRDPCIREKLDHGTHVVRGGAWCDPPWFCRSASRSWVAGGGMFGAPSNTTGFRVALDVE
jgi:formylglycine-generating enzyme required for sulfatase activity